MLQRMSPFLALFGPCAMSDLSPECAPKRTFANASCRQRPVHHLRSDSPSHGLSLDYQGDIITRTNVDMNRNLEMLKKAGPGSVFRLCTTTAGARSWR